MNKIDVTDMVSFENPDDESLPLTKCYCGKEFPVWEESISIYTESAWECPSCHRKLVFSMEIRVFMVTE